MLPVSAAVPPLEVPPWLWVAFCAGTAVLLVLDMFVFHRDAHEPTLRESAMWTVFWCTLALAFNGLVWWLGDWQHAVLFLTGYLVEWSLSMDNVFVFVVIFAFFGVPLKYQYRVLFWGILGAIVMRLTFILAAGKLLERLRLGDVHLRRVPGLHRHQAGPVARRRGAPGSEHSAAVRPQVSAAWPRDRTATSFSCGRTASCSSRRCSWCCW